MSLPHTRGGVSLSSPAGGEGASLPHTRGGVSSVGDGIMRLDLSSPHAWGCFRFDRCGVQLSRVFPTRVGVFPTTQGKHAGHIGLPHTRGGVSFGLRKLLQTVESSPHAWGCFRHNFELSRRRRVFPKRVGVFLSLSKMLGASCGLPHTRGGVSRGFVRLYMLSPSSPHAWGCFPLLPGR